MAAIQSLGIGSGLLTSELVDDLVAAEREGKDNRLNLQKAEYEAEISAFGTVISAVETLRNATSGLTAPSSLQSVTATSSGSGLSATASSVAEAGTYTVRIDQLAQSHSIVSKSFSSISDVVGTGELTFRFGTTTFSGNDYDEFAVDAAKASKTITIDSTNNTLSSLRSAINNADFGVQASIVNDGNGFRLLLATEDPGLDNSMQISVAGDAGTGLAALAYNATYNGTTAVGAITQAGGTDLSTGVDFSATNAVFTLSVGAVTGIDVTVNEDATTDLGGGGGTAEDNRIAVQNALDTALVGAGLVAGDVIASIDPDTDGIVFTTLATGSSASVEITADDGVLALNPNLGARFGTDGSMTQTQAAQSAELTVNGLDITRDSNLVTEVVNGVTLNLQQADPDSTLTLTLAADTSGIVTKVEAFIDAFNELKVISDELTAFDLEAGESGLLLGDSTLRSVNNLIRNVMSDTVDGLSGSFRTLAEVGIFTDQNNSFLLELDTVALNAAINENPEGIVSLFANNTDSTDALIEVVNTSSSTQPGSFAVVLTQIATQGDYTGEQNLALDNNVTINDDNDTFVVSVDGITSDTVTLTQGNYATGADLASELQLRINNDENLEAAGKVVTVSYNDTDHRFEFTSSAYGSASSISFDSEDTDLADDLGFGSAVGTVTAGLDVKGSINGDEGTGTGQYLRASDGALAAKPGFVTGAELTGLGVPLTVTAGEVSNGDYDFKVNIDGVLSGTLSIAAGTYNTAPELATAMQDAINADATLAAASKSVTVDFDAGLNGYGLISAATGIASSANFTSLSTNVSTLFGFAIGGGTQGTDASGDLNDAAGMRVRVLGGSVGSRGTISYIEGITYTLESVLDDMLSDDGLLDTRVQGLNTLLDGVAESQADLDARMEVLQNQLSNQFLIADSLIAQLKTTEEFLVQQLDILNSIFSQR